MKDRKHGFHVHVFPSEAIGVPPSTRSGVSPTLPQTPPHPGPVSLEPESMLQSCSPLLSHLHCCQRLFPDLLASLPPLPTPSLHSSRGTLLRTQVPSRSPSGRVSLPMRGKSRSLSQPYLPGLLFWPLLSATPNSPLVVELTEYSPTSEPLHMLFRPPGRLFPGL